MIAQKEAVAALHHADIRGDPPHLERSISGAEPGTEPCTRLVFVAEIMDEFIMVLDVLHPTIYLCIRDITFCDWLRKRYCCGDSMRDLSHRASWCLVTR
jgi:hypothetical protein